MDIYVLIVIGIIVGYLFGSIPFALIVGKVFYKTDVRNLGSGNLGSTNVARTLGPVAGLFVFILDFLKGGLIPFLMYKIAEGCVSEEHLKFISCIYCITGFFVCLGHCYPIFSHFKGGKAVASIFGYLVFMNYRLALLALISFIIAFAITRIVSVGSLTAAIVVMPLHFIPFLKDSYLFTHDELNSALIGTRLPSFVFSMVIFLLGTLLIYRHLVNIKRLIHHEEKKFSFAKNKKS